MTTARCTRCGDPFTVERPDLHADRYGHEPLRHLPAGLVAAMEAVWPTDEDLAELEADPSFSVEAIIQAAIDNPLSGEEKRSLYSRVFGILHPEWDLPTVGAKVDEVIAEQGT
jgi:hypothetical protein